MDKFFMELMIISSLSLLASLNVRVISRITGRFYWVFEFIGVSIHEISHALMGLFWLHKIRNICFYKREASGKLGAVEFAWDSNSLYQNVGVPFVALAPIFGGAIFLWCGSLFLSQQIIDILSVTMLKPFMLIDINFITEFLRALTLSDSVILFSLFSIITHAVPSAQDFKVAVSAFGRPVAMSITILIFGMISVGLPDYLFGYQILMVGGAICGFCFSFIIMIFMILCKKRVA